MSYRMRIDDKSRKSGRFISRVHHVIQDAVTKSGMKQQEIAEKLGTDRSVINRRVLGKENLTLRSVAELAWALDQDIVFSFIPKHRSRSSNFFQFENIESSSEPFNFVEILQPSHGQKIETASASSDVEYVS